VLHAAHNLGVTLNSRLRKKGKNDKKPEQVSAQKKNFKSTKKGWGSENEHLPRENFGKKKK